MRMLSGRMGNQVPSLHPWITMGVTLIMTVVCLQSVSAQVPATLWAKFNRVNSTEQFMMELLSQGKGSNNNTSDVKYTAEGHVDPHTISVVAGMVSQGDRCTPRSTSVQIPAHTDPNVIYYPPCVVMERCGGCCGNDDMLYCAPTEVQAKTHRVLRARYPHPGAESFVFEDMEDVSLDQHKKCECRCRVQPYHCHSTKQEYLADACRCRCLNEKEATRCGSNKVWDDQTCACRCRYTPSCLMDEVFSHGRCRCEPRVPTTTAPPGGKTRPDPCKDTECGFGREPRRVSDTVCRCQLATVIMTSRSAGHGLDRFPMMRAGVFGGRKRRSVGAQEARHGDRQPERKESKLCGVLNGGCGNL